MIKKRAVEQPLDATLRRFTGYRLKRAYSTLRADLLCRLEPLGLRITTYSTLVLVVDNPGLRQSALANALEIKRSNMVVIIDELEHRGWIKRKPVPADRRAHSVFPTALGKGVCKKAVTQNLKDESRLLSSLKDEEVNHLSALLGKIEMSVER